jgi:hypothetical protein
MPAIIPRQDRWHGSRFVPGPRLAREFYSTFVRLLLEERFPRLPYAGDERDRVVIQLGPARSGGGFPATSSRSSFSKVQWPTNSSRSISTATLSSIRG